MTQLRILLTGRDGQLGRELQSALAPLSELHAVGRAEMDLSDVDSIRNVIRALKPALIVNAAAYTAVDRAEQEREIAMHVNAHALETIGAEAKRIGAPVIHYSTDYVFDGRKDQPYVEDDAANPLNVYGSSKLAGEQALASSGVPFMVFRTSWVYASHGKNFLLTMLRLAAERSKSGLPLKIVADQFGSPTAARDIAHATRAIITQAARSFNDTIASKTGVYHMTSPGKTTWYDFAAAIIQQSPHSGVSLLPITTSEYPTPATRPANSLLNCAKLAQTFQDNEAALVLPTWQHGLRLTLDELQKTGK